MLKCIQCDADNVIYYWLFSRTYLSLTLFLKSCLYLRVRNRPLYWDLCTVVCVYCGWTSWFPWLNIAQHRSASGSEDSWRKRNLWGGEEVLGYQNWVYVCGFVCCRPAETFRMMIHAKMHALLSCAMTPTHTSWSPTRTGSTTSGPRV